MNDNRVLTPEAARADDANQSLPVWHAPVITKIDIRRTLQFCGSGEEDFLSGGKHAD